MRIHLLTYSTRPRGGVVHTLALAEALAAQGQQVTVWTLARGGDAGFFRAVEPAVTVQALPFPAMDGETVGERVVRSIDVLAAGLATMASSDRLDVVHAQDCISANAADLAGLSPFLRTVHHLDHFSTPELVRCHERALRAPSGHVTVSAAVADELAGGWGIRAMVIPNGVHSARFATAAEAGLGQRWQAEFGRYVVAVGGIEPRKGTLDLVEAMAKVQRDLPGTPLVIVGGDTLFDYRDYRREVLARAAELGVAPVLLGPVDDDVLPAIVAGAAAFAFPSVQEGFGLAAMEALAAGIPVVMRDLPVLREVFGGAPRYAVTADELHTALVQAITQDDPDAAAGRALARSYTWESAADAHVQLYRDFSSSQRAGTHASVAG
jgi:glycosyltransferase-like protein